MFQRWCFRSLFLRNSALRRLSTLQCDGTKKPIFFDMIHSNNAARVRLWMALKRPGGMGELIETRMIQYPDLQDPKYGVINPLKKVPALIRSDSEAIFESSVILSYLEDKYSNEGESFVPDTPEERQFMELIIRMHDLYVASPNCTAAGFSHSQGAMYLSYGWHGAARGMDLQTRAAKLAELWRQLSWLELVLAKRDRDGCYLLGSNRATLADFTLFPTLVFIDYIMPRFFGWPDLFDKSNTGASTPFPRLASWYTDLKNKKAFKQVHEDIWNYWVQMDAAGQFQPILDELSANKDPELKFQFGVPRQVTLNYQEPPPEGKSTGRYIGQPDKGDVVDEHVAAQVSMHDARELWPPASLETHGFTLQKCKSEVDDFTNESEIRGKYYPEMTKLVREATGAQAILVFDHTVRETGLENLNALNGGSAAPVARVHCDYTEQSAPRRLARLAEDGIHSTSLGRRLNQSELEALSQVRYAFVNVWRSIDKENPVLQMPLAVCAERSVPAEDRFLYELRYKERTGENYSLRYSDKHKWYHYPRLNHEECLIFKVFDKDVNATRFVFHTAFQDPDSPPGAPPRNSIEIRTIAFFDPPVSMIDGTSNESQVIQAKTVLWS